MLVVGLQDVVFMLSWATFLGIGAPSWVSGCSVHALLGYFFWVLLLIVVFQDVVFMLSWATFCRVLVLIVVFQDVAFMLSWATFFGYWCS